MLYVYCTLGCICPSTENSLSGTLKSAGQGVLNAKASDVLVAVLNVWSHVQSGTIAFLSSVK